MEHLQSGMQTLLYAMYGLQVMGVLLLIAAFNSLVIGPLYRKHFHPRFRVKTVVVQGCPNHYYAEFKAGWDYNWGTIDRYTSGNYRVTAEQDSVIPFESFGRAEKVCCRYKEYRNPTKSDLNKESYTEVCDK